MGQGYNVSCISKTQRSKIKTNEKLFMSRGLKKRKRREGTRNSFSLAT